MAELIVAVFDTATHADAAVRDLETQGVPSTAIRRYKPGDAGAPDVPGVNPAASRPETRTESHGFFSWLMGEDHEAHAADRQLYDEHLGAGRVIISINAADDPMASRVMRVLEDHEPDEIKGRSATESTDRTTEPVSTEVPIGSAAAGGLAANQSTTPMQQTSEEVIPLAAEQIQIDKRPITGRTTRIRRYVVAQPVEETIALRDERTTIERRVPAAGTAAEAGAFQERTVEVRDTHEEPVVSKTANVVEEVVVHKEGTEREATVRDSVRKEEVAIDKEGEGSGPVFPEAEEPTKPIVNQPPRRSGRI